MTQPSHVPTMPFSNSASVLIVMSPSTNSCASHDPGNGARGGVGVAVGSGVPVGVGTGVGVRTGGGVGVAGDVGEALGMIDGDAETHGDDVDAAAGPPPIVGCRIPLAASAHAPLIVTAA